MDLKKLKVFQELFSRLFKSSMERTINDYKDLAASHPKDMRIQLKIAELYFKSKNLAQAIVHYQRVAAHYVQEGFQLKAVAIYKNILKLDPTMVGVNLALAEAYLQMDMTPHSVNQYRIAMQHYTNIGNQEKLLETCKRLVSLDPSPANRRKLAEVYQINGQTDFAVKEFEILARIFKEEKKYDDLLRIYELIIPHKGKDKLILRDICILYLRKKDPLNAMRTLERNKVDAEPEFLELYDKAKLMRKMLRGPQIET